MMTAAGDRVASCGRRWAELVSDWMFTLELWRCHIIHTIGDTFAPAVAAAGALLENIGVTAASNNAARVLRRLSAGSLLPSSSNREHPTNGVSGDIEAGATEAAPEGKLRLKILLPLALGLIALASAVPFAIMSTNIGGRMTRLSRELTLGIALAIVFLCVVIISLLYFWGMRCLHTATFICVMVTSLFVGLVVLATLAALHRF